MATLKDPDSHVTTFNYVQTRIKTVYPGSGFHDTFTPMEVQGLQNGGGGGFIVIGGGGTDELVPQSPGVASDGGGHLSNAFIDWLGFGASTSEVDCSPSRNDCHFFGLNL